MQTSNTLVSLNLAGWAMLNSGDRDLDHFEQDSRLARNTKYATEDRDFFYRTCDIIGRTNLHSWASALWHQVSYHYPYWLIPVPDCVPLVRYRTVYVFSIFIHSGIGLTGCQRVRHLINNLPIYTLQCSSTLQTMDWDTACKSIQYYW
jgi:hypothetical protein